MPNDVEQSVVPTATPSKAGEGPKYNEDANLLEVEDTPEEIEEVEEVEEDTEEQVEESEEVEQEEELPKIAFNRPTITEIKEKYPELFKDFPDLKEAFFREARFTQLFPTIEDAQEAVTENEAYSVLSEASLSGDPTPIIESLSKTDKNAFEVFSHSFLPSLYKKDSDLYGSVVAPIFQNLVRQLHADKDENTRNAALVLADYIFGSDGEAIAQGKKNIAKNFAPSEEQKRIKDERDNKTTVAFRGSVEKVTTNIKTSLASLIAKSSTFDPDKVFAPALRKMGAEEAVKRIMAALDSDEGHKTVMRSRWKKARANGYTTDDESKIVSTYLARAKSLIPSIASKVSAEMLGTKQKHAVGKDQKVKIFPKQNLGGRPGGSSNGKTNSKDYSKMSDLDILND